jgi:ABC-type cobalamin/Fe3+-siderophores transport system ATPase subunit
VSVVYGDNGTGKTTILRLLYASLSTERHRGLRTFIAKTHFFQFSVFFSDGSSIVVNKEALEGSFDFIINRADGTTKSIFIDAGPDNKVNGAQGIELLDYELRQLDLDVLFVDHNRVVQSTYKFLADIHGSRTERQILSEAEQYALNYEVTLKGASRRLKETDLQFPLPQVVAALESAFRAQAFRLGAVGDQGAAAVYLEIVKSITKDRRRADVERQAQIVDVVGTLESLKDVTASYIRHGLLSEYPFESLISLYSSASKAKKQQIELVIIPFLDSIQRRLAALDEVHRRITVLESELSKYLPHKNVSFHILEGLRIADSSGPLELDSLSSGERQLIFLLCAASISRDKRSLILIDEPELSLNYKWQRMIAGSLANISAGGETQYILASHSIEIITRYVNTSFELPN